jgi:LPXTG-motif cell wall-anchored protein
MGFLNYLTKKITIKSTPFNELKTGDKITVFIVIISFIALTSLIFYFIINKK